MADIFTAQKRSEIMSRIRSSGTTPEAKLYSCLRSALGSHWRVDRNVRALPGQPDVVVPRLRLVLFADGCFYHSCPKHGHHPKSNLDYWGPKLERTKIRDKQSRRVLRKMGFTVWGFWEHDLKIRTAEKTVQRLKRRLKRLMLSTQNGMKPRRNNGPQ